MNSDFQLLQKTEKTIQYIQRILPNFPKKEFILKGNIEKCTYNFIECIFAYQINQSDRIRQKYLKDLLIQLAMLNFYMKISFQKKYISNRQYEVIGRFLIEIRKIVYGVIRSEQ